MDAFQGGPSRLLQFLSALIFCLLFSGIKNINQAIAISLPPSSIHIQAASHQIILTWGYKGDAACFRVYRSYRSGQDYVLEGEVPAGASHDTFSFTDSNLINHVTYYYVVTAVDSTGGQSPYSTEVAEMPNPQVEGVTRFVIDPSSGSYPIKGDAPIILSAEFILNEKNLFEPNSWLLSQVRLGLSSQAPETWTEIVPAQVLPPSGISLNPLSQSAIFPTSLSQSGETYYVFCFSTNSGLTWAFYGPQGRITDPDQVQQVEVLGILSWGSRPGIDAPTQPGQPELLVPAEPASLSFRWAASSDGDGVAGYDIYRAESSETTPRLIQRISNAASISFEDTHLAPHTHYTYFVRAFDIAYRYSLPSLATTLTTTDASPIKVMIRARVPPVPSPTTVYLNRTANSDHLPSQLDWQAQPMNCNWNTLICTCELTLQKGIVFSFNLSRGNPGSIQTLPDGRTPVPDQAILVPNDAQTVSLTVYAWDDPLGIDHSPSGQVAGSTQPVWVRWNQAMPSTTILTVEEKASAQFVPGKLSFSQDRRTLRFSPDNPLKYGATYQVSVADQEDLEGNPQQVPLNWEFTPVIPRLFLPVISLH